MCMCHVPADLHCVAEKSHPFNFCDVFVRYRPILQILAEKYHGEFETRHIGLHCSPHVILYVRKRPIKKPIQLFMRTPSLSYGVSLAIWDHTVLPDTRHKWKRAPPNPSYAGWYSIYLPQRNGRLSWPRWLNSTPAGSRTSDLSITSPTPNRCTTKTTCML